MFETASLALISHEAALKLFDFVKINTIHRYININFQIYNISLVSEK